MRNQGLRRVDHRPRVRPQSCQRRRQTLISNAQTKGSHNQCSIYYFIIGVLGLSNSKGYEGSRIKYILIEGVSF